MWRRLAFALLVLLTFSKSLAGVEAEVKNHYIQPGEPLVFHVDINESYAGSADLKFCLAEYDFDKLGFNYRCDIFLRRHDIDFSSTFSKDYSIPLSNIEPCIYRLFVQLHFSDKYHKDCDKDNFFYFAANSTPIVYVEEPRGVVISAGNISSQFYQDEHIEEEINLTNFENCSSFLIKSYIFRFNYSATGKLNSSLQSFNLPYGSSMRLRLSNHVLPDAPLGHYNYEIVVQGCSKEYRWSKPVEIVRKKKPNVFFNISHSNLIIKNYENFPVLYELRIFYSNRTLRTNGTLFPHYSKRIRFDNASKFVELSINNELVGSAVFLFNETNTVYVNRTLPVTIYIVRNEGKSLYIISILTSIGALAIIYKRLR